LLLHAWRMFSRESALIDLDECVYTISNWLDSVQAVLGLDGASDVAVANDKRRLAGNSAQGAVPREVTRAPAIGGLLCYGHCNSVRNGWSCGRDGHANVGAAQHAGVDPNELQRPCCRALLQLRYNLLLGRSLISERGLGERLDQFLSVRRGRADCHRCQKKYGMASETSRRPIIKSATSCTKKFCQTRGAREHNFLL